MSWLKTALADSADKDAPASWKRVACTVLLLAMLVVSALGLCLMIITRDSETAKWIAAATAALVALFIIAILFLMGYATDIEKAIIAARGKGE